MSCKHERVAQIPLDGGRYTYWCKNCGAIKGPVDAYWVLPTRPEDKVCPQGVPVVLTADECRWLDDAKTSLQGVQEELGAAAKVLDRLGMGEHAEGVREAAGQMNDIECDVRYVEEHPNAIHAMRSTYARAKR